VAADRQETIMGKGFKDLVVWQQSRDLAILVYNITNQGEFKKILAFAIKSEDHP
jgi:hypothetical protein